MRVIFLAAVFVLISCAPEIVNTPIEVDMPVAVTCKTDVVPVPDWATNNLKPSPLLFPKVQAFVAANEQHKGYETQLVAANSACQ